MAVDPTDVELIARVSYLSDWREATPDDWDALPEDEANGYREGATAVLAALAAEGRLLPPEAVTRTEWGIRGNLAGEVVETSTADALDLCPTYGTPVTRTVCVGPWLPAPEETP